MGQGELVTNDRFRLSVKSHEKRTTCICPLCKKKHHVKMWYTGHGVPYKYCQSCLNITGSQQGEMYGTICG